MKATQHLMPLLKDGIERRHDPMIASSRACSCHLTISPADSSSRASRFNALLGPAASDVEFLGLSGKLSTSPDFNIADVMSR